MAVFARRAVRAGDRLAVDHQGAADALRDDQVKSGRGGAGRTCPGFGESGQRGVVTE